VDGANGQRQRFAAIRFSSLDRASSPGLVITIMVAFAPVENAVAGNALQRLVLRQEIA